jgi:hypothetical protein
VRDAITDRLVTAIFVTVRVSVTAAWGALMSLIPIIAMALGLTDARRGLKVLKGHFCDIPR